jgi:hypothetical protein
LPIVIVLLQENVAVVLQSLYYVHGHGPKHLSLNAEVSLFKE